MSEEPTPLSDRALGASAGEINALLGRATEFRGTLTFEGKVRIDGRFSGEVLSEGTLVLGDEAYVEAEITVGTLIVRGGTVRGNVRARAAVEVYAPGKVYGNITAAEVFIDKGVIFEGACKMTQDDDFSVPE